MESFERAKQDINILDFVTEHVTDRIVRKGRQYFVSCPKADNGDSDPSLAIYPEQNSFYCFHCGDYYGSIIDFVKGWINTDSNFEALKKLSELYPELNLLDSTVISNNATRTRFIEYLTNQANSAANKLFTSEYEAYKNALIDNRKISVESMKKFGLGIKDMNGYPRLTFPNYDVDRKVLAISSRQLVNNDPRSHYYMTNVYIDKQTSEFTTKDNPNKITIWEKNAWLYNIYDAIKEQAGGTVFIVEGHLDVIAAYEEGISAVATGWKVITPEQAALLEPFSEIVISPDKDAEDSVIKTYAILRKLYPTKVIKVFCQPNSDIKDFGDLRKSGLLHNGNILNQCIFAEKFLVNKYNYNEIVDLLDIMTEPVGRTIAIQNLSEKLGINAMLLSSTLDRRT